MALSITPNLPVIAPIAATGGTSFVALQPGTIVNAEVLKVADDLVQIAIADLAIDVLSEVPLVAGQSLQLAVAKAQDGGVKLAIVGQGTSPATAASTDGLAQNAPVNAAPGPAASAAPLSEDPLTPPERVVVSVASQSAASQQQSLAPLFANL
ncbi:MAG: flagellar hook-length control protein FliK, partial [Bradyrhizobium sp.]